MPKVSVGFNQQQKKLLDQLKNKKEEEEEEGGGLNFGESYSEIVKNVLNRWLKENGHIDS